MYGISQNPDTKDYILVLEFNEEYHCNKCGDEYDMINYKWCKSCHINDLKANATNCVSGIEDIDNLCN